MQLCNKNNIVSKTCTGATVVTELRTRGWVGKVSIGRSCKWWGPVGFFSALVGRYVCQICYTAFCLQITRECDHCHLSILLCVQNKPKTVRIERWTTTPKVMGSILRTCGYALCYKMFVFLFCFLSLSLWGARFNDLSILITQGWPAILIVFLCLKTTNYMLS